MPYLFDDIKEKIDFDSTRKNVELVFARYHRNRIIVSESERSALDGNIRNKEIFEEIQQAKRHIKFVDQEIRRLSKVQQSIITLIYKENPEFFLNNQWNLTEDQILKRLNLSHSQYYRLRREAIMHFALFYDFSASIHREKRLIVYRQEKGGHCNETT